MKNEERGFLIFLLVLVLAMTAISTGFSSSSRMLPMIAGVFSTLSLLFLLSASYVPRLAAWYGRVESKADLNDKPLAADEKKKELFVTAWFIGSAVLVYLLGFIPAILLFLFLFLRLRAKESWVLSLAIPIAVTAAIYITFIAVLRVPLYTGLFF